MIARYKPFSLVYDLETTRPGEQVHAEAEPLSEDCARRLRDIERAGRLRNEIVTAETRAWASAHFCRFDLHWPEAAERHIASARFYDALYTKVCRLELRAYEEASDG